jgi:glycosyltransferase involved in cell wall biosynthesis
MKILFILPRFPYPILKGDKLRAYYFIKGLSSKNIRIDLCAFYSDKEDLKGVQELKKYCCTIKLIKLSRLQSFLNLFRTLINLLPFQVNYFYSGEMKKTIEEMVTRNNYDLVHISLQRMMLYSDCVDKSKLVLDHIDTLSLNMKRRVALEKFILKRMLFNFEYVLMERYERGNQNKYAFSLVTSEEDKKSLRDESVVVIPNGVDTKFFCPEELNKDIDIIFLGNMSYFPNIEAVLYSTQ